MVTIYTENINNRLKYACKIIFHVVLRVPYQLINDSELFEEASGLRIFYGNSKKEGVITIPAVGLLKEEGISEQENKLVVGKWNGLPTLFSHPGGHIPFDMFSAVFYIVTRYEEYLIQDRDEHNRFTSETSILNKMDVIQKPIIDLWCIEFARKFEIDSPLLKKTESQFRYLLTIDVDHAWYYKHYRLDGTVRKLIRPLVYGKFREFLDIVLVLLRLRRDPANVFKYLSKTEEKLQEPIQYFILNGTGWGYDKSNWIYDPWYRWLIRRLNKKRRIGIHPSYRSNEKFRVLNRELHQLSRITKEKIEFSRQHYLMLFFPDTYQRLIRIGIKADFSLGFAETIGFRAGIARPFPYFNLPLNKEEKLTLVPFMAMDRSLQKYQGQTPEKALESFKELIETTKSVGGRFVSLWHNTSLSEKYGWEGWRSVFEELHNYIANDTAPKK